MCDDNIRGKPPVDDDPDGSEGPVLVLDTLRFIYRRPEVVILNVLQTHQP